MKRTKIVCTIGPASDKVTTLEKMISKGMNVARLNFSHGDYSTHRKLIRYVRAAAKKKNTHVAILQDLQGPRIRVGDMPEGGVEYKKGAKVAFVSEKVADKKKQIKGYGMIPIQYADLYKDVKKGVIILIEDGTKRFRVDKVEREIIKTTVVLGGVIKTHKGINVPGVTLNADVITEKDKNDVKFGAEQGVDFVALSFVKDGSDIRRLKTLIKKHLKGKSMMPKIIAKIERIEAIENFDDILNEVDGIMVARGDLGIELPAEHVPLKQKQMIHMCLKRAKPVIVATQMLDSMISNLQPTRAEVSDVANAVIDHTDAVMLSGESAAGKYPVETVDMMARIVRETEDSKYDDMDCEFHGKEVGPFVAHATCESARMLECKAIVVLTRSGESARLVSRNRPELRIIALTTDKKVQQQLVLSWGVEPYLVGEYQSFEQYVKKAIQIITSNKIAKKGDKVVITCGYPVGKGKRMNTMKIVEI